MIETGVTTIDKVIDFIDSSHPFDLVHVTADENRGTGGVIKTRKGWVKCQLEALPEVVLLRSKIYKQYREKKGNSKIRLILNPVTQEIRAVHLRLICEFNGKRVV